MQICKGNSISEKITLLEDTVSKLREQNLSLTIQHKNDQEIITSLRQQLAEKERIQHQLALTAITRPTTSIKNTIKNSVIQNLTPLLENEMKNSVPHLTVDHIKAGPEGYAKYALSHPLKDKVTCTDASRKKLAWKNESGEIVYDVEGSQLSEKFFRIIKERNFQLFRDIIVDLGERYDNAITRNDQHEADTIAELTDKIGTWRKQAYEASRGDDNELRNEFVKYLCIMTRNDI